MSFIISTPKATVIEFFMNLMKEITGQELQHDKKFYYESRLETLLPELGFQSLMDMAQYLKEKRDPQMIDRIIDVLLIHETSFYRDRNIYTSMKNVLLPKLIAAKSASKSLRIFFTACSTGQEVYTFAMMLDEFKDQLKNYRVTMLATDISNNSVAKAKLGVYNQFEIQRGLPVQNMLSHFEQKDGMWHIKDSIKKNIEFRKFNIVDTWAFNETFDIIFCRNVLLYMNIDTRKLIVSSMSKNLTSDGLFVIGATETLLGVSDTFISVPETCGVYQKKV
jgi:chemotaxis protein methyltransferase CheR